MQTHFIRIGCKGLLLFSLMAGLTAGYGQDKQESGTRSDDFDIKKSSFLLPQPLPSGKYTHTISLNYVLVPKDWAHDFVNAPMFGYSGKYTLPAGFNIQGSLYTLFVSTRANLGPFWNHSFGNFHLGLGYQVAFNLGYLGEFGFNTLLTGWEFQPSITTGYSFKKSALVLRIDRYNTSALYVSQGGNTVEYTQGYINGYSLTTSLEQRLWKNRLMSFGVKLNYVRYHILAWPALPVNAYRYVVPEFQIGLKF